jgi:periplasmic divalent cation tolerance protein
VGYLQVVTTIDSPDEADRIGRELVQQRLVACFQVLGPIRSTYRWQGAVEQAEEWLCLAKTTTERYDELASVLVRLHPYDTPEIIATPIVGGHSDYLEWIATETGGPDEPPRRLSG